MEIFIRKIYSKLKFLNAATQSQDITYLDANRWEKLIFKYLPQLEKFLLQYHQLIDDDFVFLTYSGELNQFTLSFWIERQWLLEAEIDYEQIKYLIRPFRYVAKTLSYEIDCLLSFRARWYEYADDNIVNSSSELSKSARLNIMDMPSDDYYESIIKYIKRILSITQIYHFEGN